MSEVNMNTNSRESNKVEQSQQRSFVRRKTVELSSNASSDKQSVENLALIDMTNKTRIGFRGANSAAHLSSAKIAMPSKPNKMVACETSALMTLRLSDNEYWLLDGLTTAPDTLPEIASLPVPEQCYHLYCQNSHAWFMLTGQYIEQVMAKLCGVDLRLENFALDDIAQTSLARVNAVIVRHEINHVAVFSILSDSASAEYLWDCILDAMTEFSGKAVDAKVFEK